MILKNDVDNFDEAMKKFKNLAIDYKLLVKKLLEKIEEEALNSKKNYNYKGLSYEKLKELAFELADITNYVNMSIDPYLLIEITLLKYFNNSDKAIEVENKKETKIISQEKEDTTPEVVVKEKEELSTQVISREIIKMVKINPELIKIRVNNCFVNAKKEYLQKIKEIWLEFISTLEDKSLLNLIIDCNVVTASDQIVILTNLIEGTANLINTRLIELENRFNSKFHTNYKFITLTEDTWKEEKEKYIVNLKNKIEYHYIEEPKIEEEIKNNVDNIEKIAYDIFDKEKIEIE